jgi:D-cysteine desulfhydrase
LQANSESALASAENESRALASKDVPLFDMKASSHRGCDVVVVCAGTLVHFSCREQGSRGYTVLGSFSGFRDYMVERAIFDVFPSLVRRLPLSLLGNFPTPVEPLTGLERALGVPAGSAYVKRDDLTSPLFGGNKVRTLEVLFAAALAQGATRIFATGAFGSNHGAATVVHAPRVGLEAGALLYPQPPSAAALGNLRAILAHAARFVALPHWSCLPAGILFTRMSERRRGRRSVLMVPGGATPEGALGYVSAALELSLQVHHGAIPRPARVLVPGGSGCTTAGLLAGFTVAARLGIGFTERGQGCAPEVCSVRVTPWPVTSHFRLVALSARTTMLLAALTGNDSLRIDHAELAERLRIDGRFLGRGYGHATDVGRDAIRLFERSGGPALETTYSAKAAAAFVRLLGEGDRGPTLFWATRSHAPPPDDPPPLDAPASAVRWMARTALVVSAENAAQP